MNCKSCGAGLSGTIYFCQRCWEIPSAKDKAGLYSMHHHGHNTDTKVAKIVRLIAEKREKAKNRLRAEVAALAPKS